MKNSFLAKTRPFAVVTGASSGIGKELARQFAQHGYDLLIVAEDDGINSAATELSVSGTNVTPYQCDLSHAKSVDDLYAYIRQNFSSVDAAAINAGVGVHGAFVETDLHEEIKMIRLNVLSVVHLTKLLLKDMVAAGEGKILFTSSVVADTPSPFLTCYAATKAFIHSFVQGVREEIKDSGVTLTALQPGATDTNFFHRAHMDDTKVGKGEKDDPALVAKHGFEALMAGKSSVVAGSFQNKVQNLVNKLMPETVNAKMTAPGNKPVSHHH